MKALSAARQVGVAIRRARRSLGLTQRQLAKHVGYSSPSYISNVESGRKNLTLAQCERFARALKLPISAFFDHEVTDARTSRTPPAR